MLRHILDKVFKSGQSKFTGRQLLKNLLKPLLNNLPHINFRKNAQKLIGLDMSVWNHLEQIKNLQTS